MDKKALRKEVAAHRDALPLEMRESYSAGIMAKLVDLSAFHAAGTISCFVSFRSEINTVPIIKYMLANGKRVVLPITDLLGQKLVFSELKDFEKELAPSSYGILEPKKEFIRPIVEEEIDLVLTPGLVFDTYGYRIGYGGGFYDRFLGRFAQKPLAVALAFEVQVLAEPLPSEEFDIPVDMIVTEQRLIDCVKNRSGK